MNAKLSKAREEALRAGSRFNQHSLCALSVAISSQALMKLIDAILFAVGQWEEAERMDNGIDFCNFVAISSVLQTQSI